MKVFFLLAIGIVVIMVINSSGTSAATLTTQAALPAAQRTAVYAVAVATRSAGAANTNNANASAAAQEAEAARVYAQAAADEQHKRIAVATQQAVIATQTANEIAISKEYATLTAVSLQATSEAISRTIAIEAEQYQANLVSIRANKQAMLSTSAGVSEMDGAQKSRDYFLTWVPLVVCLPTVIVMIVIALYGFYLAAQRLAPPVTQSEINALRDELYDVQHASPLPDVVMPPDPDQERRIAKWNRSQALTIQYIEDSIRRNGGRSAKLLTALEWKEDGHNSDDHTEAVAHLRKGTLIKTQNGGKSEDQGTFVQKSGQDLLHLYREVMQTPLPANL